MALRPTRRTLLAAGLAAGATPLLPRWAAAVPIDTGPPVAFSFEMLRDMARTLAEQPYVEPPIPDAALLETIDYDLHNQITYRPDSMLWGDVPGAAKVRFFHPGRYFKLPVEISVLADGTARELEFSTDLFDMPADHPARKLTKAGFAGFAVMDPDGEERLDGGARRLLPAHLGLFRPVRHVGARASRSIPAAPGRRSSRASAASGSRRARPAASSSTR